MISNFKFLRGDKRPSHPLRRWIGMNNPGRIYWLTQPVNEVFYMESTEDFSIDIPSLNMQMFSMTVTCQNRMIRSIDHFMETNNNKIIMVYQFVEINPMFDISGNLIYYDANNFHQAPRDRRMIFRGIVRDINVF